MSELLPLSARYDLRDEAHDYPEWIGPPRRSVLVCTHPRSGSTMLGEALYFAGGLGCPLEFVHAGSRPGFEEEWGVTGARALIREAWRRRTHPNGTFAAKLFWRDIADLAAELAPGDFPDLHAVAADQVSPDTYRRLADMLGELFPGPVPIHLERRDRLRQAVSGVTAAQTGVWRVVAGAAGETTDREVAYDFDLICRLIAAGIFSHAHWRAFFAATALRLHAVSYEELVADYASTAGRLLRALGHEGPVPPPRLERQSTGASEALIRRFLDDQRRARRG